MAADSIWSEKDLIGIERLSRGEIECIFDKARSFKEGLQKKGEPLGGLRGKTVVLLFAEPSTRTRVSFEIAAKKLGADVVEIQASSSSFTKGETLKDTARNLEALGADAIVLRHGSSGAAEYLSKIAGIPVINAGDGAHEHPTQALLDCFTLVERYGSLEGKKVTIVGDILFSRVARSNIWALKKLGAEVTLTGPMSLVPKGFESMGVKVSYDLKEAVADADAVMLLRIQKERQGETYLPSLSEYTRMFGLTEARISCLKEGAVIMHPGPINRGVELDSVLADSEGAVILEQVANGVPVRMAALELCMNFK